MSLTRFMILFISSVITYVKPGVKTCWVTFGRQFLITIWIVAKTSVTLRRKQMFYKMLNNQIKFPILKVISKYSVNLQSLYSKIINLPVVLIGIFRLPSKEKLSLHKTFEMFRSLFSEGRKNR